LLRLVLGKLIDPMGLLRVQLLFVLQRVEIVIIGLNCSYVDHLFRKLPLYPVDDAGQQAGLLLSPEYGKSFARVGDPVAEDETALACIVRVIPLFRQLLKISSVSSLVKSCCEVPSLYIRLKANSFVMFLACEIIVMMDLSWLTIMST
jgi:hypothetical protein